MGGAGTGSDVELITRHGAGKSGSVGTFNERIVRRAEAPAAEFCFTEARAAGHYPGGMWVTCATGPRKGVSKMARAISTSGLVATTAIALARAALEGALANVDINLESLTSDSPKNEGFVTETRKRAVALRERARPA